MHQSQSRSRLSVVNRRQMADIAERESIDGLVNEVKNDSKKTLFYIICITIVYFFPSLVGGERNPDCKMNAGFANLMFAWVVLGADFLLSIIFFVSYACKKNQESQNMLHDHVQTTHERWRNAQIFAVKFIGYTIFFYWTSFALWPDYDRDECRESWYDRCDFILWIMIMVCTFLPALFTSLMVLIGLCCVPFLLCKEKEEQYERDNVVSALIRSKFSREKYTQH